MRSLSRNPYTNRTAIGNQNEFFGRERELRDIFTRILGGQSVLLIGERRMGKSSLLNALNFPDERQSFEISADLRLAYADCQEMAGCDETAFIAYLCQQFAMAMDIGESPSPSRATFKNLAKLARTNGLQPVLAIDEFEVLLENPLVGPKFLAFLRSWSTTTCTPMVVASREGSVDKLVDEPGTGSAFLNIFGQTYVGSVDLEDALELITIPSNDIGEPFDPSQIEHIRSLGGLYPFFLQIACYHTLQVQRDGASGENARSLVESIFNYEAGPHMQYLASRLSPVEIAALSNLAGSQNATAVHGSEGLFRKGILVCDPIPRLFSSVFTNYITSGLS
jgi:hypothetical protein